MAKENSLKLNFQFSQLKKDSDSFLGLNKDLFRRYIIVSYYNHYILLLTFLYNLEENAFKKNFTFFLKFFDFFP